MSLKASELSLEEAGSVSRSHFFMFLSSHMAPGVVAAVYAKLSNANVHFYQKPMAQIPRGVHDFGWLSCVLSSSCTRDLTEMNCQDAIDSGSIALEHLDTAPERGVRGVRTCGISLRPATELMSKRNKSEVLLKADTASSTRRFGSTFPVRTATMTTDKFDALDCHID